MLALVGAIMNNIVPPDLRYLLVARDLCLFFFFFGLLFFFILIEIF